MKKTDIVNITMKRALTVSVLLMISSLFIVSQGFIASDTSGCDSLTTTFTIITSIPSDTYLWDFGNGDTSTSSNPTVTYDTIGAYTVQLTLTNPDRTFTRENYIHIVPAPLANFRVRDTSRETLGTFQYIFIPVDTMRIHLSFEWRIDGEYIDTIIPLYHTFEEAGTYNVRLTVDNRVCQNSRTRLIAVQDDFKVPNVFCPECETYTEFYVQSNGFDPVSINIFSRSGALVYKAESPLIIWDGKSSSGHELPPGIYYYVIEYNTIPKKTKTGFVYLLDK